MIGGTSAETTLKTVKLASCRYLDSLPTTGNEQGRAFRDVELEEQILELTRTVGIGAQFGGKYFCHDVRVIRLPRHGASCPVGIGVSCSADRQILGKITKKGIFLEKLETDPARFMPDLVAHELTGEPVAIDLDRPMSEVRADLSQYPVTTQLSLSGTIIVARDIAHAKLKERLDRGEDLPQYFKDHIVYYAGPAKTPEGYVSGSFGPTTAGRMDAYVDLFQSHGGSMVMLAKGNRSKAVTDACASTRRLLSRLDRRARRDPREELHQEGRDRGIRRARDGGDLADRGRGLPRLHHRRRQGKRLLRAVLRSRTGAQRAGNRGAACVAFRIPGSRPPEFPVTSTRPTRTHPGAVESDAPGGAGSHSAANEIAGGGSESHARSTSVRGDESMARALLWVHFGFSTLLGLAVIGLAAVPAPEPISRASSMPRPDSAPQL